MKKIVVWLSVALFACTLAFAASPDGVALKVMEGFRDGNPRAFSGTCTSDAAGFFSMLCQATASEMRGTTFQVIDSTVNGNRAEVTLKGTQNGKTETYKLMLKDVDGEWKVYDMK